MSGGSHREHTLAPVDEVAPGLSFWLAPHPAWEPGENWPREVPSFRYASPAGVVVVDPQLPPGGEGMFDDDPPAWILLTSPWHVRDTPMLARRHGAKVWAPPHARWQEPSPQTARDLPPGVEALLPDGDPNEALFLFREQRALVPGDLFSGTDGRFHLLLGDQDRDRLLAWLPRLYDLPIELVLVAHGDFVLHDGAARIREAVQAEM
jgi:hypothetical protein